jgi:hypothetical protein
MLYYIDEKEVFDHFTGLCPFLLLDGHGSQFDLGFLEYINSEETTWNVNIGLPYWTSYWQVGDSTEKNGCFKLVLAKARQALVTKKNDSSLPFEIKKIDIVKLVKDSWKLSFARMQQNWKAMLHRGWGPRALNKNLLLHPEIFTSKPTSMEDETKTSNELSSSLPPSEVNISEGLAGNLVQHIVSQSSKEARLKGLSIVEITAKRHETAKKNLENHEKRCTAGLLASSGQFSLGLNILQHQRNAKKLKRTRNIRRHYELKTSMMFY